jgi:tetratricopeptide (TPR) repeat protein
MERLAARFPTVPRPRQYQAMTYNEIVHQLIGRSRFDEALACSQKGLLVQEKLAADFREAPRHRSELATAYMNRGWLLANRGRLDESRASHEKALALHEALAKDHPKIVDYVVSLGGSYCNMGGVLSDQGRPEEALPWLAKAVATLEKVLPQGRPTGTAGQFLCNTLVTRAEALGKLRRYPEALQDWDRALALEEGPRRTMFRLGRAGTLARAGKHAEASAEADALAGGKDASPRLLYDAACVYALASAAADASLGERYAARAVELLGRAIDRGYKDAKHLQKDSDLDRLRPRPDFQKLLRRLPPKGAAP